MGYQMVTLPMT